MFGTAKGISYAVDELTPGTAVACATGDVDKNYIDGAKEAITILESNGHVVNANSVYVGQALADEHGGLVQPGTEVTLYVDDDGDLTNPSSSITCYTK